MEKIYLNLNLPTLKALIIDLIWYAFTKDIIIENEVKEFIIMEEKYIRYEPKFNELYHELYGQEYLAYSKI